MRAPVAALGLLVPAAALCALLGLASPRPGPEALRAAAPARAIAERDARVRAAIARGIEHLLSTQNASGSWGRTPSNLWDIYAPVPGSYYAFETAVTGLAVSALIEAGPDEPRVAAAIRRGADWLVANHARARRVSPDTLYNVWGHAYALEAFARLLAREGDPGRREALARAAREAVDFLGRFEFVDGGWGYYNFGITVRRPEHGATSFTTAAVLVALRMAADQGIEVPRRLVDRGVGLVEISRNPDWTFAYSWDHRYYPQGMINRVKGSLARTASCVLALAMSGRPVPPWVPSLALERFVEHDKFLRIARKYPRPHESWYQNSGYFCFFGYYYASRLIERLPPAQAERHRAHIADVLVPLQEEDGSWWDYQLFTYHKPYGTAYVLMALANCLRRPGTGS